AMRPGVVTTSRAPAGTCCRSRRRRQAPAPGPDPGATPPWDFASEPARRLLDPQLQAPARRFVDPLGHALHRLQPWRAPGRTTGCAFKTTRPLYRRRLLSTYLQEVLGFVESVMDKYDAPIDLIRVGHAFANSDYGPRGPQSAPDAQLQIRTD